MAKYILLDTETTGTGELDRVIQLGFMVLGRPDEKPEIHNQYCSCEQKIAFEAMEIHNITPDMIEKEPTCIDSPAYKRLQELNTDDNYLFIQNAPFDLGMLKKEGFNSNMQLVDTLRCARHLFSELNSHRLQFMRYALDMYKTEKEVAGTLGVDIKAHDAMGDVLVMKMLISELTKRVREVYPNDKPMQKLVELTKQPVLIKTFKFGKYRGQDVSDVASTDAGYLKWMLTNMKDLDEDMRYTLGRYIES